LSKVAGQTHTSRLSTDNPFSADEGTTTTAGEIRGSLGRFEVKGKTVTLLRFALNRVPEITSAGRFF
jgi:hypothetical protein